MKRNEKRLSPSQTTFVKYIDENLSNSRRVISFKCDGHFGLEYALRTHFKNVKILNYKELKTKTGKHILFRVLHVVTAFGTFLLNHCKEVDARTTFSTVLSNMENIYLAIDKEKEHLKYLQIKKFPHKRRKIRFVIRLSEDEIESIHDIQCLRELVTLIQSRRINRAILICSDDIADALGFDFNSCTEGQPCFRLDKDDLYLIAKEKGLSVTKRTIQNIDLIKKMGLQFFIDNFRFFDALEEIQDDHSDWLKKMDLIIKQIIDWNNVSPEHLYPLLEFSSFFEKKFTKLEIKSFNDDQLKADNLSVAHRLNLLCEERLANVVPKYFFDLDAFKVYFVNRYFYDLDPLPKHIFQYFRDNHPFRYISALNVLKVDTSFIQSREKHSLIILGYYFQHQEKGVVKTDDFICMTTKDSIVSMIIQLHENYKKGISSNIDDILQVLDKLKQNYLDELATCASYVIVLQLLKESYVHFKNINFSDVLFDLKSSALEITSENNYNRYWKNHFKTQYIALSIEDEDTDESTSRRFLNDIEREMHDENMLSYISDNHLRGFARIYLLAHSLAFNDAGKKLENLYSTSEESTILKELARINYGAYLVEHEQYHSAESVLSKGKENFIKNINIDTYCSYQNNRYLARLGSGKIDVCTYISVMHELLSENVNCSDKQILQNNLYASYLTTKSYAIGLKGLEEILKTGNDYNRFLATHNLLAFYFTINDALNFNAVYEIIKIPKLLSSDTTFFLDKFKWMKDNMGRVTFDSFKPSPHVTECYNQLYLKSSIERWFE